MSQTVDVDRPHLVYFADPMCSWCYGFAPVMERIAAEHGDALPLRLIMGGLRAYNTRPMDAGDKEYIKGAWTRVAAASGQPFDHSFFERDGFVYDTEPACRAVVVMGRRAPELALRFKARVSRAFYAEGTDTTREGVLAALAAELGQDETEFALDLGSERSREETAQDFAITKATGIDGFPMLVAGTAAGGFEVISAGFSPAERVLARLAAWKDRANAG
ncbi:MAG: DsbA family protein [Hyphomicrobiaceae bacterium]|nr:MAG: DsbA family protein [Hyphomicrobiaceae bacterium]